MPRHATQEVALLGAPAPALFAAEGGPQVSLMAVSNPVALSVYQGDDKRWLFRLKQTGGAPFPLTGYTAALQFRLAVADTAGIAVTPLVLVNDEDAGEITVTLSSELSTLMTAPLYVWDLEIIKTADSWTTTIAAGTLAVTKEVTRVTP